MTAQQLTLQMINLQSRMDALQKYEADAYAAKLEAERKINECGGTWYAIYQEYMNVKEKLNALNK